MKETLQVLKDIENKNAFETRKHLAVKFDRPVKQYESTRPQSDNSVRLEITLSEQEFEELKRVKELLSHVCPNGSWSEVITTLARKVNPMVKNRS